MKTYLVVITPRWVDLKEPRFPNIGDNRHQLEVNFILTTCKYGGCVSIYWVRTDLEGLPLVKILTETFKTDKISILEVE